MPRLLIDADALIKLAHWNLLTELPSLTRVTLDDCATLESAVHRARRALARPDGRLFRCVEAAQRVCEAAERMRWQINPDMAMLATLQNVPAIDVGEAVLLCALLPQPDALLLTGDKRALRALASLGVHVRQPWIGRLVTVEQVLLLALDQHGLTWLRQRVCPWLEADKAIALVMGSGCDADESSCRAGLESYIRDVDSLCAPSMLAKLNDA